MFQSGYPVRDGQWLRPKRERVRGYEVVEQAFDLKPLSRAGFVLYQLRLTGRTGRQYVRKGRSVVANGDLSQSGRHLFALLMKEFLNLGDVDAVHLVAGERVILWVFAMVRAEDLLQTPQ